MTDQVTSRGRLEALFRRKAAGGLTLACEDGVWTASVVVAVGEGGAAGRPTTTIEVVGHKRGIEESCADIIGHLLEAGVEVP